MGPGAPSYHWSFNGSIFEALGGSTNAVLHTLAIAHEAAMGRWEGMFPSDSDS